MINQIGEITLAILESIIASKIYNLKDTKAAAADFFNFDESVFTLIEEQLKENYEKEQIHDFITQNQLLPNHNYSFISEQDKANFINRFFEKHTDLKYPGHEEIHRCLEQYVDKVNEFLRSMLSAEGKIITQQIHSSANSVKKEIQNSEHNIISAIKDSNFSQNEKKEPIYYHIGKKNKLFFGRAQTIDNILSQLRKDKLVFLIGAGGMGKSQIAQEIVFQLQDSYELILWFSANTEMELLNEFNTFAIAYGLTDEKKNNLNCIVPILSAFIGNFSHSLIVYDGADDFPTEILTGKYNFTSADIIITTQNSNIDSDEFSVILIDTFTPEEASSFLTTYSNSRRQTEKDANIVPDLCNLLENYPLALEYARSYVNKTQNSFEEYMQIYAEHKHEILNTSVSKYKKTAYTAWKISYDKVIQQSVSAKNILNMVSFLDTHDIPLQDIFVPTEQPSAYELSQAILTVKNYSLFAVYHNLANIHGITQEFIRLQMQEDGEYQDYYEKTLQILSELMPGKITNASEKNLINRIIKHAIKLISHNCNINDEHTLYFASDIASKLYVLAPYLQTAEFIQGQIEKYSSLGQNIYIFQMITFLAQAYHYTGDDDKSLEILKKYFPIVSSSTELTDIEKWKLLARYKNVEGIIQKEQEDYSASLKTFSESLTFIEKLHSKADDETKCNILMNLGIVNKHLCNYEAALEYYNQALLYSNDEKHLLLRIYGNMATAYENLNQTEAAFQYLKKCLRLSKELGDQRNECICLQDFGDYYIDIQQYDDAKPHFIQSLKIAEEINYTIGIINASYSLGRLAFLQHNFTESKKYLELSLKKSYAINYKAGIKYANNTLSQVPE